MAPKNTIFAISTPPGKSGVAIIRISGPMAAEVPTLFHFKIPRPRHATLVRMLDQKNDPIDLGVALWFPAPASFTGEDVFELQIHGSRAVTETILSILSSHKNFRLAEPGEFSKRAFENEKMDLVQAEGLADLIDAETSQQLRQAHLQLDGILSKACQNWREKLVQLLAYIEAYIDFPEEGIPEHVITEAIEISRQLLSEFEAILNGTRAIRQIREGYRIAILGAPNTGKSSLLNWFAKSDYAIVSDAPGTTRDVLEFALDLGGYKIIFFDTAGIRETEEAIEKEGVRRSRLKADESDLNLVLFDAEKLPALDVISMQLVSAKSIPIFSRIDRKSAAKTPDTVSGVGAFSISVKTGEGIDNLIKEIENRLSNIEMPESAFVTRERQAKSIREAAENLENFRHILSNGRDTELAAEDLRQAVYAIGKITGKVHLDEVLDALFRNFCIGK